MLSQRWCRALSPAGPSSIRRLFLPPRSHFSSQPFGGRPPKSQRGDPRGTRNAVFLGVSGVVGAVGVTFLAVPLYRIFCEKTSFAGLTQRAEDLDKVAAMEKVEERLIRVRFNADVPSSMQWNFKPMQKEVYVHPGETALIFYTAKNPTDKPIIGISSYNLTPFQAAYYFNKIQCFCFEEQILDPGEEVELPVFFYIDPDYANDPQLQHMNELILSYTFYNSRTTKMLPSPFDPDFRPNLSSQEEVEKKRPAAAQLPVTTSVASAAS